MAEYVAAAAFTRPVGEPEPTVTETAAAAEFGFTEQACEGEIADASAMRPAARPADFDLAG
ncbi:hypothetical protein [Nocardia cyriacigeorgica]|uniref:hypothetical protein n=1 Tax=Nocardia cyriacigeorgica TaxID=135487 RepID=UPI000CEA5F88|nr:hypothetical protein [Nocardia cyriacigeorgica]MBF6326267.1 hypothetical protein [Nocardia cyriacigeorgica]MBF6498272.1 hypothetical protein [Nocardia cyriacigeorgica]PPJ04794.1 hypothetical protein C5E43_23030 [Nocardia cyriacigeorgica]